MPVEYEVVDGALRINCMGWAIAPSIEDSEATMAIIIDHLLKARDANRVVLLEARENEYDVEQTRMLREIADAYNRIINIDKIISLQNLGPPQCEKLFPRRLADLQFLVFELLRKDPIGAYIRIVKMVNTNKVLEKTAPLEQRVCFTHYLDNALIPIKQILEGCTLIQKSLPLLQTYQPGNRDIYRELFSPTVRPNFMLTRFMLAIPKGARLIEKYSVPGAEVEIYKLPNKVRYLYHVIPREFVLSDEKYSLLDSARRYLAAHRPTEAEAVEPERSRELFKNLGRDLVRDVARTMNVSLSSEEIEELATILARYTAGYGVLEILLADEKIQDVFINSPIGTTAIFIFHSDFEECETNLIPTNEDAEAWATRFRLYSGRPLDESNPVLDTELIVPGGRARVAAITRTLSPEGLAFAFRRHREKPWTFPLFVKNKMFDPLYAGLMSFIIDGGRAILVAGGRGSGKTSVLGSIMLELMPKFRVVTVEDTLELPILSLRKLGYNIERMKSRSVITRVETELPAEEALRTSLRLGDSVLIIGEIRSSLKGDQEVFIVEDGISKRVPISTLENKDKEKIFIPTLDTRREFTVKLEKLKDFVKHPKRDRFIRIKTKSGREVTVTPEHSVFTLDSLSIVPIESGKLKKGSKVIIPSRIISGFNNIENLDLTKILSEFRLVGTEKYIRLAIKKLGSKRCSEICGNDVYVFFTKRKYRKSIGVIQRIKVKTFIELMNQAGIEFDLNDLKIKRVTSNILPAEFPINSDFCRFLGYFVSEGYIHSKNNVTIANANEGVIEDIRKISLDLFNQLPIVRTSKSSLGKSKQIIIVNAPLASLLTHVGLNKKSYEKRIPNLIYGLNNEKICEFLRGLYAGDGSFSGIRIEYSTVSKGLANDLLYLLLALGIVGRVHKKKQSPKSKGKREIYCVEFSRKEDVKMFLDKVKFTNKKPLARKSGLEISKQNMIDFPEEIISRHIKELPSEFSHLKRFLRASKFYLRKALKNSQFITTEYFKNFVNGDFYVDEVEEVEELRLLEPEYVYDLSVNPTENFIGGFGGILLHNTESLALFEAMRVGSMANLVAGTVHGESAYGVYDRIVHDLGVPPTSFKALDLITVCNLLKSPDGLHRFRRVTELTEVRKHWKQDPLDEGGFVTLMEYSAKEDRLKPTDTLLDGESQVLNEIAKRVREWHGQWDAVWDNILLRAKIKETMVDFASKLDKDSILEADYVVESNSIFHLISEQVKQEVGALDSKMIYDKWLEWFKKRVS